jgi:hypothetical protein
LASDGKERILVDNGVVELELWAVLRSLCRVTFLFSSSRVLRVLYAKCYFPVTGVLTAGDMVCQVIYGCTLETLHAKLAEGNLPEKVRCHDIAHAHPHTPSYTRSGSRRDRCSDACACGQAGF